MTAEPTTRYVIVVHGIGQQRKGETVLPVIHRFAEARGLGSRWFGDPITRGMMASHQREAPAGGLAEGLQEGWIEFDGIPQDPAGRRFVPFVGRKPDRPGENLRFVDMHWASVMDNQFEAFGEPVEVWTRALIDRLEGRRAPAWILEELHTVRRGVIPLRKLLRSKVPGLSDEIFSRFLGDVQLYGEYLATRGMAVRRFHERLAGIERRHQEAIERSAAPPTRPAYTIIAHSLGSIMSFDALVFGHMVPASAGQAAEARVLEMLPEYDRDPSKNERNDKDPAARFPDLGWIRNVDSLVTLGSPIDKFLILWWLNYEHLVAPGDDWLDEERLPRKADERIRHFNYCDAQDPVGHELDVAYSPGTVTHRLFRLEEDEVFTRYSTPGVAHVDYWGDGDLFRRILDRAVDGRPAEEASPVVWFKPWSYLKALVWSYLAIPILGWLASSAMIAWTLARAESSTPRVSGILVGVGILLGTGWLMRLMIAWREVLSAKEGLAADRLPAGQRLWRRVAVTAFRVFLVASPLLWLGALRWATEPSESATMGVWGLRWPVPQLVGDAGATLDRWVRWLGLCDAGETLDRLARRLGLCDAGETLDRWAGRLGLAGADLELAALIALAIGLLLASWRLVLWLRLSLGRGRWRELLQGKTPRERMQLDFQSYLDTDPTRADPVDEGES